MRTILGLAALVVTLVASAWAADAGALFADAVRKYQEADYVAAAALNERILQETRMESPAVYFNLGNSYFKQGKLGKAVLNYRRAEAMSPRDGDIRANLAFARSAVEQPGTERGAEGILFWQRPFFFFNGAEMKWLFAFFLILTGLFWLAGTWLEWPFKRVVLLSVCLGMGCLYMAVGIFSRSSLASRAGVVLEAAEARFEPSLGATVYFKVPEGSEVQMLRSSEGWTKVERRDKRTGWLPDKVVGKI